MKVLLIEDNETHVNIALEFLEQKGIDVDVTNGYLESILKATDFEYDVIILDLIIWKHNGLSLLRRLRSYGNYTPAIIFSAVHPSKLDIREKDEIFFYIEKGADSPFRKLVDAVLAVEKITEQVTFKVDKLIADISRINHMIEA